ncbi:MAG: radical SAM protein [Candidatus Fraserbacteria bacterium RBG_16_55_9]|uniref:Radical SAM protein n=1 Tax=Fraserbacteria sp. (strain RBG_16_55_9) TaxID=1817864 RepID=A0A1F5UZR2_FRAXR|nr:MAG: radical SAM protein [Candidatus Fraserbacteria bacterium RBG_16_55_9]
MRVIARTGREEIAMVYIAELSEGRQIEFVESVQPPLPREEKWVLIISTLFGCPIGCLMCDAGGGYRGKLSKDEIFSQIDYLVKKRFPDGHVPVSKFKIQFARMGEPSFNSHVLEVLEELPRRYDAPGLLPSLSTIAPHGTDGFFERLLQIKQRQYSDGRFQLQFSIHTTDIHLRDRLIPVKKWDFAKIANYGERFHDKDNRKITLNFALAKEAPLDSSVLSRYFSPEKFLVKITPLNPTHRAQENRLCSHIDPHHLHGDCSVVQELRAAGFEVIQSIGEVEENRIGSNCGQYVTRHLQAEADISGGYDCCSRPAKDRKLHTLGHLGSI